MSLGYSRSVDGSAGVAGNYEPLKRATEKEQAASLRTFNRPLRGLPSDRPGWQLTASDYRVRHRRE
jgi:hypothetical protein